MAFLTIGGIPYDVQTQGAAERTRSDRRSAAEGVPTYSGGLRRQGLARKREWPFTTGPLSYANYTTLVGLAANASNVCAGDAMPAGGVSCLVSIEEAVYVEDAGDPLGFVMVAQIMLREK